MDLDSHTFGSCAFGGAFGVLVPDLVKWWFQIGVAWSSVWFLGDGFDTIETWVSSVDVTVLSALIVNLHCAASNF